MTSASRDTKVFTKGFALLSLGALAALGVLISLGTWQVKRLHWKQALVERVETRISAEPQSIEAFLAKDLPAKGGSDDPEYLPLVLEGRFDHETEFFYYATLDGKPGFHIYSPFSLAENDQIIFINRGFVPDAKKDQSTRPESLTSDVVEITGLFRWPDSEKPNSFIPDNDTNAKIFFWRDIELMMDLSGVPQDKVLPFFVYSERDDDGSQLPIGGVTIIDFPNSHLAYAATWYGLALTLIGVYGAMLFGRIRKNQA